MSDLERNLGAREVQRLSEMLLLIANQEEEIGSGGSGVVVEGEPDT